MTTALKVAIASMAAFGLTAAALPQAAEAQGGCGHGWHRNHHGFCRPNHGGGGGWGPRQPGFGPAAMVSTALMVNALSNMSHQNQPAVIFQQQPPVMMQPGW